MADADKIRRCAERVLRRRRQGYGVIAVVSAPGEMTDDLLELAQGVGENPDAREMDVLLATGEQIGIALFSMALKRVGQEAISLTGPQAGIYADSSHTQARILKIQTGRIREELGRGRAVVVAGFQGLNPRQEVATLGRGGSDLTAVALAAAFRAKFCEIFTDVKGVYTADPRVVSQARLLRSVSQEEMLEMAASGAQVLQTRAVEVARKFRVPILVRATFQNHPGTWIYPDRTDRNQRVGRFFLRRRRAGKEETMEEAVISAVTWTQDLVKITAVDVPDRPGVAARLLKYLAEGNVPVDMILQSGTARGVNNISLTMARQDFEKTKGSVQAAARRVSAKRVLCEEGFGKVSVVGMGMRQHAWVAARMFEVLAKLKVNIEMIATSEIRLSCIIAEKKAQEAVRALHRVFCVPRR